MIDHLKGELLKTRRSIRNPEDKIIEFGGNVFEFGRGEWSWKLIDEIGNFYGSDIRSERRWKGEKRNFVQNPWVFLHFSSSKLLLSLFLKSPFHELSYSLTCLLFRILLSPSLLSEVLSFSLIQLLRTFSKTPLSLSNWSFPRRGALVFFLSKNSSELSYISPKIKFLFEWTPPLKTETLTHLNCFSSSCSYEMKPLTPFYYFLISTYFLTFLSSI